MIILLRSSDPKFSVDFSLGFVLNKTNNPVITEENYLR